ncbi:MAG: SPOR domain-containing protein [candidate division Zixibacteria bacterium]|nr:SPOR domain-containing protein [candidate division Zixibacteria bacterium]
MNIYKLLVLLVVLLLLGFGCSRKQEEASQLEQEMLGGDDTTADMLAAESLPADMDAGAIPVEEELQVELQLTEAAGYFVQMAACESSEYARYLADKYVARGYEPYVTTTTVDGQTYYRVRIGGLETLQQAKELKAELADKYSIDAWIDKTD